MAQLPSREWLIQQVGDTVILFHRDTEEEVVRFPVNDQNLIAQAQGVIAASEVLSVEDKAFAHFWSGYFFGCAVN